MIELLSLKLSVARAQLGTALSLFIENKDSFSIQSLACGAGEILDGLLANAGGQPFSALVSSNPDVDLKEYRILRNQYWNALKHLTTPKGLLREDADLLNKFSDAANDAILFAGWHDYMQHAGRLPIAAQIFQVWWYAIYEEKLAHPVEEASALFPNIRSKGREIQKGMLRDVVKAYSDNKELLAHCATDPTPLVISAI